MDPHLVNLRFNGPNFGAGLFHKYQTGLVETQKVWQTLANCEEDWIRSIISLQGGITDLFIFWGEIIDHINF
jgi:hypothetical protein